LRLLRLLAAIDAVEDAPDQHGEDDDRDQDRARADARDALDAPVDAKIIG